MAGKIGFGIDVGATSIKFAMIKASKSQSRILQLAYYPLPSSGDHFSDESARDMKSFLKKKNLRIRHAVAGISGMHVNIRYLKLPFSSVSRIPGAVSMEMEQVSEKAGTSLSYGYLRIPLPENKNKPETSIMIGVAYDSFLNRLSDFFKKAGIHITSFLPNAIAMHHAFVQFGDIPDKEIVYLLDIGQSSIDMAITFESNPYFFRNLNLDSSFLRKEPSEFSEESEEPLSDILEAEESPELEDRVATQGTGESFPEKFMLVSRRIPDVVEASLKFAKFQTGIGNFKIDRMLLSGGFGYQPDIPNLLKSKLRCPVLPLTLEHIVRDPEASKSFDERPMDFANAIGLGHLACGGRSPIHIVSNREKMRETLLGKNLFEYASVAMMFLVVLFGAIVCWTEASDAREFNAQLTRKHGELSEQVVKLREIREEEGKNREKMKILSARMTPNQKILELLDFFYRQVPAQMVLGSVEFKSMEGIQIFTMGKEYAADLDQGSCPSALKEEFEKQGRSLSPKAAVQTKQEGKEWVLLDEKGDVVFYRIVSDEKALSIQANLLRVTIHGVIEEASQDIYSVLRSFKETLQRGPLFIHLYKEEIKGSDLDKEEGKLDFVLHCTISF